MADVKEFRKKPVVIQAIQWDGTLSGMDEILSVFTDIRTVAKTSHPPTNTCSFWKIGTLEGSREVSAHDFVIRGVKGEYYPCKPDIFFMTYEPATTTPPADAALADELLRLAGAFDTSLNNAASVSMNKRAADSLRETLIEAAAALRARAVPDDAVRAELNGILENVEGEMQSAYHNAYHECCGRSRGGECCGSPDPAWSKEDQSIMDKLAPIQRRLRAMLAASKAAEGKV